MRSAGDSFTQEREPSLMRCTNGSIAFAAVGWGTAIAMAEAPRREGKPRHLRRALRARHRLAERSVNWSRFHVPRGMHVASGNALASWRQSFPLEEVKMIVYSPGPIRDMSQFVSLGPPEGL